MRKGLWPCTVPPILRYLKHSDSPIQPDPRGRCIGRLPSPPPDCVSKGRYLPHLTSSMLPDLAEPCRGQFTTPLRVYATATTLLNTEPHL